MKGKKEGGNSTEFEEDYYRMTGDEEKEEKIAGRTDLGNKKSEGKEH